MTWKSGTWKTFKYLGTRLAEDGELLLCSSSPTECRAGGRTGRECMQCDRDRKINTKNNGNVYRTVVLM